jgi:selenium metabolism protein YedF
MYTLDCRLQTCPTPVVEARKLIMTRPGEQLEILVGDDVARDNVGKLARNQGYGVEVGVTDGGFSLQLAPGKKQPEATAGQNIQEDTIVFVTSDLIGSGDDELGSVLMKNFIMTLQELDSPPTKLIFLNGGVKLTCAGSDLIETLDNLACYGVEIISCGLCLEYFGLREKLVAGRVGNMLETVEALATAGRIIRP